MKIFLCLFGMLSLLRVGFADVESRSVDIKAAPAQSGPVTVHATASDTGDLRTVSVAFLSRSIEVPKEALADIHSVDIRTKSSVRGIAWLGNSSKPQIMIGFNSYDPSCVEKAGYPANQHIPVNLVFEINPTAGTVERFIMACEGPGIPFHGASLDHKEFKLQQQ